MDDLLATIDQALALDPVVRAHFKLPASDGASLAMLHAYGRVLDVQYKGTHCDVEAEVPESLRRRLARYEQNPQ
jgi:hypothetical protein